ncbi:mitochondrial ATP synthase g subunit-domain-containing protein [Mycena maculata]|uniref:Mitochondrial ATP synthase g subunit-domain-containing protein n=1 Tax=Mycena maculata TaxID=230809 RepID=A0AAD7NA95_9AGAR|nr:mitochondrial ATP synthase g subunit-domain-containing protein [Mycena maculata]
MSPLLFSLRQAVRPALRQRIRFNSSNTPPSPEKKAQEVIANAQKSAGQLWESATKKAEGTLGPAADKAEVLLGSARKSFLYNLAVAREIVKQVYRAELQPPKDLTTVRTAYETLYSRATDATYWRSIMQSGEIVKVAIYAVEAYGIFKIGEIIGRRKIVGYPLH